MEITSATLTSLIISAVAKLSEPAIQQAYQDLKNSLLNLFSKKERENVSVSLDNIEAGDEAWKPALESSLKEIEVRANNELIKAINNLYDALKAQDIHVSDKGIYSGRDTFVNEQTFGDIKGDSATITGQRIDKG